MELFLLLTNYFSHYSHDGLNCFLDVLVVSDKWVKLDYVHRN